MSIIKNGISLGNEVRRVYDRVSVFSMGSRLGIDITDFADGSKKVSSNDILKATENLASRFTIMAYPKSMDDIMIVAQIVDIIKRNSRGVKPYIKLEIGTPMYARYDRVMHKNMSDAFGLDLYVKFLSVIGIDCITTHDPHSRAFGELVRLSGIQSEHIDTLSKAIETLSGEDTISMNISSIKNEYILVAPDKGLKDKLGSFMDITCDKARDPETGKINGVEVTDFGKFGSAEGVNKSGKPLLILDDICERGGTFFGVAKALRDAGVTAPISLCVTHGIMPEGTKFDKLAETFDNVFVNTMSVDRVYEAHNRIVGNGGSFYCCNIYK